MNDTDICRQKSEDELTDNIIIKSGELHVSVYMQVVTLFMWESDEWNWFSIISITRWVYKDEVT